MQSLLEITRRLASSPLNEAIPSVLAQICQYTQARGARLVFGDFVYVAGADQLEVADAAIYHHVMRHGALDFGPISQLEAGGGLEGIITHLLALPLNAHQHQFGVLWVGYESDEVPPLDFLEIVAGQLAFALASSQANQEIRAILASIVDPVILVDDQLVVQSYNPSAVQVFGENAVGKPVSEIIHDDAILNHLRNPSEKPVKSAFELGGRSYQAMISNAQNGGSLLGRVLVLTDVSHFKRLNENMTLFLQTVSHDLRSPLTAAKGFVDMMPMVGELNEKQHSMKEKVLTSIVDMTNLVEKVLDAGRLDPEMGAYALRRETCDPTHIVEKVITNLSAAAHKKNLILRSDVAPGVPILNLDQMMLERALVNLVENAVKYTPANGTIDVQAYIEDDALVLAVQDNGFGIPEDKKGTLFDRGSRIRREEHKQIRGSGLGLFIVKNVAQQHGGEAVVESKEGQGSTFKIIIPISGQNVIGAS